MRQWPIRLRMAMLTAAAGGLAALTIGGLALLRAAEQAERDLDVFLGEEAGEAFVLMTSGIEFNALADVHAQLGVDFRAGVVDTGGNTIEGTDRPLPLPGELPTESSITYLPDPDTGEPMRVVMIPVTVDDGPAVLIVAAPTATTQRHVRSLGIAIGLITLLSMVVLGAAGYVLIGMVLRPIDRLRRGLMDLSADPRGRRLELPPAHDEIRSLATTFNEALEEIDQRARRERQFVAEASHELRTPLARLRAEIDLARRPTRTAKEISEALASIDRHVEDLIALSSSLLDLSEADRRRALVTDNVSVLDLLASVQTGLEPGWLLQVEVPEGAETWTVSCDRRLTQRALANLVENAFRHGAPPVSLEIERSNGNARFVVADRGPGIPAELRDQLLRPFTRGPGTSERAGAGLGLTVAAEVAAIQGGGLEIADGNPGCRVILALPLSDL
jgi:signal transduction histidine kinase